MVPDGPDPLRASAHGADEGVPTDAVSLAEPLDLVDPDRIGELLFGPGRQVEHPGPPQSGNHIALPHALYALSGEMSTGREACADRPWETLPRRAVRMTPRPRRPHTMRAASR